MVSWSQCRLLEQLPDDGDPATTDTQIVPCLDENLANVVVIDPDNPVTPAPGEFFVAPPLYGIWIYDPRDETQMPIVPGDWEFRYNSTTFSCETVGTNSWPIGPP